MLFGDPLVEGATTDTKRAVAATDFAQVAVDRELDAAAVAGSFVCFERCHGRDIINRYYEEREFVSA